MTDKEIRKESIKKDPRKRKRKGVEKPSFSHCGPRTERSPRFGLSRKLEGDNITIEYLQCFTEFVWSGDMTSVDCTE